MRFVDPTQRNEFLKLKVILKAHPRIPKNDVSKGIVLVVKHANF